jgi:L-ascorbate metabolism protein UlaG (beta-lactamase superfamily)
MHLQSQPGGARALLDAKLPDGVVGLAWLGQAGFLIRHGQSRVLIDPYLSNRLARKHSGTEFSHERMMPPPLQAAEFQELDLVFCTHRHGDHMDPDTLTVLAKNNPLCRFVLPRAELKFAQESGLAESRLVPVTDGESVRIKQALEFRVVASAHEALQTNKKGDHHFLGFALRFGDAMIYHSGDSLVYEGLSENLREMRIDLALLPVNGRSNYLSERGIVGNMNFDEAAALCLETGIPWLIPTHFGMFAFNTVAPEELQKRIGKIDSSRLRCQLPEASRFYSLISTA